jgi:hypothetical protein
MQPIIMQVRKTIFLQSLIAITMLLAAFSQASAASSKHVKQPKPVPAPGALDGKTFIGALTEIGIRKGREEMLQFKNEKFTSTHCIGHGFPTLAYDCKKRADGSLHFIADQATAKHGIVHWDVVVYGSRLDGVMTWAESQEKVHTYGVHALLRPPAEGK